MNESKRYCSGRTSESALTLAVRLAFRQLSDGIGIDEAVQIAARFHNVTCAAIEAELVKKGGQPNSRGLRKLSNYAKLVDEPVVAMPQAAQE
jgi:hypothetical protein